MSDDSSNDSGSTDLRQTLEDVNQITRDFESLTAQLKRDSAMMATLSTQSQRSSGRVPANQQTTALPALLQGVAAPGESIEDFVITAGTIKIHNVPTEGLRWGGGIKAQGEHWETTLESKMPNSLRLPPGSKTFDFFNPDRGMATSAKTLNTLTLSRLTNPVQLYRQLVKYVDEAAEFSEVGLRKIDLTPGNVKSRGIQVAIPSGTTAEQMQQLDEAVRYGRSRGVNVMIRKTK